MHAKKPPMQMLPLGLAASGCSKSKSEYSSKPCEEVKGRVLREKKAKVVMAGWLTNAGFVQPSKRNYYDDPVIRKFVVRQNGSVVFTKLILCVSQII